MELSRLEEFVTLSKTLNFSAAAAQMHMSQSTLSKHVAALERELGVALINHSERPTLTDAGRQFSEDMSRLVELYADSVARIEALQHRRSIKVGMPLVSKMSSLGTLARFAGLHPEIAFDYQQSSDASTIIAGVRQGTFDCGIYGHGFSLPDVGDDLLIVPCGEEELVLWLDNASSLLAASPLTPASLNGTVMPTPLGPGAERIVALHKDFAAAYGLDVRIDYRYFDSVENFFLSKVGPSDVLVFHKGFATNDAVLLRSDRTVRSFDPPVFMPSHVVLRAVSDNLAVEELKAFLVAEASGGPAGV